MVMRLALCALLPPLHLAAAPAGVVFTAPREAAPHTGWFSVTHNEFLDSLKSPGGVRKPGEDFSARSDPPLTVYLSVYQD